MYHCIIISYAINHTYMHVYLHSILSICKCDLICKPLKGRKGVFWGIPSNAPRISPQIRNGLFPTLLYITSHIFWGGAFRKDPPKKKKNAHSHKSSIPFLLLLQDFPEAIRIFSTKYSAEKLSLVKNLKLGTFFPRNLAMQK